MCGHACREAALLLRQRLEKSAIELLAAEHVVFELESGRFQSQSGESASWFDVVCYAEGRDGPLFAIGTYETDESLGGDYKGGSIGASPAYSFTAHVVEVKVDVETGHYDVVKIWAAHDCGRAVNPTLVEGQIQGSVYMGWSEAVMEEQAMVYGGTNPGLLRATNLLDYPLPTIVETPEIEAIIVESDDGQHGLGVKEAGEGLFIPYYRLLPTRSLMPLGFVSIVCPFEQATSKLNFSRRASRMLNLPPALILERPRKTERSAGLFGHACWRCSSDGWRHRFGPQPKAWAI